MLWFNLKIKIKILIDIVRGGDQLGPLGTAATNRPIVPAAGDYDDGEIDAMIGRGNRSTCPSAALSTTNPTYCPDTSPGRLRRSGKSANKPFEVRHGLVIRP
jgi:hypothetical protein